MQPGPAAKETITMCAAYFDAIREAEEDVAEALGHIRAEQDAGRITVTEAAAERVQLLERHLERCRQLRAEHLGSLGGSRPTGRSRWTAGSGPRASRSL
jgi:hypothetical protein